MSMTQQSSPPSSSTAGPTLEALQRALVEISSSIASFSKAHADWYMYHQGCFAIVGNAWQDYQTELASHTGAIKGLRALRTAVQKELQWAEKHSAQVGPQTVFPSSNAFYLCTYWQHVLYSVLHQSPLAELDATVSWGKGKAKAAKVDIICQGGKRWIRLSNIKPLSLLCEFRNLESYVVDENESDEEEEEDADHPPLSLDLIKAQLAKGQVDGIAAQCSLMKTARELQEAADQMQEKCSWGRPVVELVLTRIALQDMTTSLEGKFYDADEKKRFEMRVEAMLREMERMQLVVMLKDQRQVEQPHSGEAAVLPSSLASGETAATTNQSLQLPLLPAPPQAPRFVPTATLNLDLSALVALVSQISHIYSHELPNQDDYDQCFRKDHWKRDLQESARSDTAEEVEEQGGDSEAFAHTQHTRALSDQLRREMTDDCFFNALIQHLQGNEKVNLICTKEAEAKFVEILALVGGSTEQRRAEHLFQDGGQDEFWAGSKWEKSDIRDRIVLPVQSVDLNAAEALPAATAVEDEDEFRRLARNSVQEGLQQLQDARKTTPYSSRTASTGTGIQRQTIHTLASLLYGLVHDFTTLTTNTASIKWLARDIVRCQVVEGSTKGYTETKSGGTHASAILFYPRSLAEKMMKLSPPHADLQISSLAAAEAAGSHSPGDMAHSDRYGSYVAAFNGDSDASYQDKSTSEEQNEAGYGRGNPPFLPLSSPQDRRFGPKKIAGALVSWIRGPRPRTKLIIRHYRWWPMQPVETFWLRCTASLAWKDPNRLQSRLSSQYVEDLIYPALPHSRDSDDDAEHDSWQGGVRRDWKVNKLHWIVLSLTFIAWAFGFTFLVKGLWYDAAVVAADGSSTTPSFYGCTTTFWLGNAACGLNGGSCAPFSSPTPVPFRCPASCETTTLGGVRAVGDQLPNFVTLVVGGAPQGNSSSLAVQDSDGPLLYRGDSFVCSAAYHAGVLSKSSGGCGSMILSGAYSGYRGVERNGITSTPFNSSFPVSYYFESDVRGERCTDRSYQGYILDDILLAFVGFVLQPKHIVFYFTLITVGFWHINFISEPREYPMSVGGPMGDFLPTLFVAYVLWRLTFRRLWPAFERLPLERNVYIQCFFWIGVLLNLVFVNVPLQRLVASDISTQPGALTALIVIIVVVVVIVINQIRVIRKVGQLPKYLTLAIVGGVILGLLSAIPTTGFRLHHYIIAMILLPFCAFPTRLSLIYSALLIGMFLNGVGRWGYDGIIQDVAVIVGSGLSGSTLPVFLSPSNWTGVPNFGGASNSTGLVYWEDIPSNQADQYDSFALLIDDVLRLQSSQTFFNISQLSEYYSSASASSSSSSSTAAAGTSALSTVALPTTNLTFYPGGNSTTNVQQLIASQPHFLRLAYYDSNSGSYGDFTKAATLWFNGTFVSPLTGAT